MPEYKHGVFPASTHQISSSPSSTPLTLIEAVCSTFWIIFADLPVVLAMGLFSHFGSLMSQSFPPKSNFNTEDMPDLTGRVCIVTGGNTGVGFETVKALLEHNAKVYIASRNKSKVEDAVQRLKTATGKEALFLELDLGSLASIRKAAKEFLRKEHQLHILFNNAGVMVPPIEQLTTDGYDLQFGTNVLGHFYFTELLMPALFAGKETSPDGYARIITTSSSAAYGYAINWDTFIDGPARKKLAKFQLYAQSKFGNVVVARQVAQRYADKGILSMSCNPGNLKSDLQRHVPSWQQFFLQFLLYPASYGALTQLWGGTMPETIQHNGQFLIPWARPGRVREEAYDPALGEKLWGWLKEEVDKFEKANPDN